MSSRVITRTLLTAHATTRFVVSKPSFRSSILTSTFTRTFQSSTARMGVHNVATKADFETTLNDNDVVILDAFATWCGPCKAIAPQVVKFSEKYTGATFIKIDVDELPDVAQELGIRAMPTFIVFKSGEKVAEVVGANIAGLQAAIEKAVIKAE